MVRSKSQGQPPRINYQPQLVSRISSINSSGETFQTSKKNMFFLGERVIFQQTNVSRSEIPPDIMSQVAIAKNSDPKRTSSGKQKTHTFQPEDHFNPKCSMGLVYLPNTIKINHSCRYNIPYMDPMVYCWKYPSLHEWLIFMVNVVGIYSIHSANSMEFQHFLEPQIAVFQRFPIFEAVRCNGSPSARSRRWISHPDFPGLLPGQNSPKVVVVTKKQQVWFGFQKIPRLPNTWWGGIWTPKTYLKHLLRRYLED